MKVIHDSLVGGPTAWQLRVLATEVLGSKGEERELAKHFGLELVVLRRLVLLVRRDAATTVYRPATVRHLDVGAGLGIGVLTVVVIVVERSVRVIALNQPSARCIEVSGRQSQARVLVQRIDCLDQALAERVIAKD